MARRFTPSDEYERVSERLRNKSGSKISDKQTFLSEFNKMIETSESNLTNKQKDFRERVFKFYAEKNVIPIAEKQIIKKGRIEREALRIRQIERRKEKLTIPTTTKGKVTYSEKIYITIKNKQYIRYRNAKGQWSSIKC